MKLLTHPGGALFVLAFVALLVWLISPHIWVIGGVVRIIAFAAMVFGALGGVFLTLVTNRAET